jgi:hypothetical protein
MTVLNMKAFGSLLILFLVMVALLFALAGTLDYWQAWTFLAIYFASSLVITLYLVKKGSGAFAAKDEREADSGEGNRSKNHHVFHIAGIHRPAGDSRTRSSLGLVSDAAFCGPGRRCACCVGLARHFLRFQGKYL